MRYNARKYCKMEIETEKLKTTNDHYREEVKQCVNKRNKNRIGSLRLKLRHMSPILSFLTFIVNVTVLFITLQ